MGRIMMIMLVCLVLLISCDFVEKRNIIGNYYLIAADVGQQMSLTFKGPDEKSYGTIVSSCVYAVGYNNKYIIVKQHPYNGDISRQVNKDIVNFYIIPIESIYIPARTPLNEFQFNQKRQQLGIENIQFSIIYKDLE